MSNQTYHIYTGPTTVFDAHLDASKPVRVLIAKLVAQVNLPASDQHGFPITYALFAGNERRRLSSEQTLEQAAFDHGGDLYLAPADAPWWIRTFVLYRPEASSPNATSGSAPRKHVTTPITASIPASRWPISPVVTMIVFISLVAAIGLWMFLSNGKMASETVPDNSAAPVLPGRTTNIPTATLLPIAPTSLPTATLLPAATIRAPTATLVPIYTVEPSVVPKESNRGIPPKNTQQNTFFVAIGRSTLYE